MKSRYFAKIALCACLFLTFTQTHAQDPSESLPLEVWGYIQYATWSADSTQFTFASGEEARMDPPTWYTYDVTDERVAISHVYPLSPQLLNIDLDAIQAEYVKLTGGYAISPQGTYLAYVSSERGDYGNLLGIANLQTGAFVTLDVELFSDIRYEWSADETTLILHTMGPYGWRVHFLVQDIEPSLSSFSFDFLGNTTDEGILAIYDINADGTLVAALAGVGQRGTKLLIWDIERPDQKWVIDEFRDAVEAQFSLTDPSKIYVVAGGYVLLRDLLNDNRVMSYTALGVADVKVARFSPNQTYVAIVSPAEADYYDRVNVVKLATDSLPRSQ